MFIAKDLVISIGDTQITGKNAIISELDIKAPEPIQLTSLGGRISKFIPSHEPCTVTIELKCAELNYIDLFSNNETKIKIKNKKVKDCTISELLFSVREKVKR